MGNAYLHCCYGNKLNNKIKREINSYENIYTKEFLKQYNDETENNNNIINMQNKKITELSILLRMKS
jgi:hypothetical protein